MDTAEAILLGVIIFIGACCISALDKEIFALDKRATILETKIGMYDHGANKKR